MKRKLPIFLQIVIFLLLPFYIIGSILYSLKDVITMEIYEEKGKNGKKNL